MAIHLLDDDRHVSPSTGYSNDTVNTGSMSNFWSNYNTSRATDVSEFSPSYDDNLDSFQMPSNQLNSLLFGANVSSGTANLMSNNSVQNSMYGQKLIPKNTSPISKQVKTNTNPNSYYKMVSSSKNFNINAPSYVPRKYNAYDVSGQNYNPQNYNNQYSYEIKPKPNDNSEIMQQEIQKMKMDIILKDQIVKNLTDQIKQYNKSKSKALDDLYNIDVHKEENNTESNVSVPTNHYDLFRKLSREYTSKCEELTETKERLEAILVAYSITNTNPYYNTTFTNDGAYDEQELSHKIICKLQLLQQENETLLKLISFGNKSSLLVEIGLLKQENESLREKLNKMERG